MLRDISLAVSSSTSQSLATVVHPQRPSFEVLKAVRTIILIEDTLDIDEPGWHFLQEAVMGVAEIIGTYNRTGLDLYFTSSKRAGLKLTVSGCVYRG